MGTGCGIRERNVFVLPALPSSQLTLRRAPRRGERAGWAGKGCKNEVWLEHGDGRQDSVHPAECPGAFVSKGL